AGGRAVGHGGVVPRRDGRSAGSGHEYCPGGGADGHRRRGIGDVAGIVVAPDPQLGAGGGVVGDRDVIGARGGPGAGPGHIDCVPAWAGGHPAGAVEGAAGAVVALDPQLRAGGGVVGDREVVVVEVIVGKALDAPAGHIHRSSRGGHLGGEVVAIACAV